MVISSPLRRCYSLVVVEAWTATRWATTTTTTTTTRVLPITSTVTRLFSTEENYRRKETMQHHKNRISIDKKVNGYKFEVEETTTSTTTTSLQTLLETWKTHPSINPTLKFDTLLVESSKMQYWIQHPTLQNYLAKPTNLKILQHVHPRIKLVQPPTDDNNNQRLLLLLPNSFQNGELQSLIENNNTTISEGTTFEWNLSYKELSFQYILEQILGDSTNIPSSYEQIGRIAHFNLKEELYKEEKQQLIGQVLIETTSSIDTVVQKVGHVRGRYRTYDYRILATRTKSTKNENEIENKNDHSLLGTVVVEDGISIPFNVAECYWCTRLSGERQTLLKEIMNTRTSNLVVADVFCGVGAVCLLLAKKRQQLLQQQQQEYLSNEKVDKKKKKIKMNSSSTAAGKESTTKTKSLVPSLTTTSLTTKIIANDWNPKAIEYFENAIPYNNLNPHDFSLSCQDAYDFLIDLGCTVMDDEDDDNDNHENDMGTKFEEGYDGSETTQRLQHSKKKTPPPSMKKLLPDHVLLNFPLDAPKFLGSLRWWDSKYIDQKYKKSKTYPRFHVYTFARASSVGANDEEDIAVNIVANELLPPLVPRDGHDGRDDGDNDGGGDSTAATTTSRRNELNEVFDANVSTRLVRDVAPGKVVVCVGFSVTPKLVRYMQGDYF
jgi:tRNA (guanine37-N1)-methyltransferase